MALDYFTGLDLGQTSDPTALAVLERSKLPAADGKKLTHYDVRHLERFHLGTPYPEICNRVRSLFDKPPLAGTVLAVDQTGVGRPVVDALRATTIQARIEPITIVFGHAVSKTNGEWHVPKKELVSCLQMLLQGRRLKVAATLPDSKTLVKELENFQVKITPSANEVFGAWREGQHDDLVLAVALAAWLGERGAGIIPFVAPTLIGGLSDEELEREVEQERARQANARQALVAEAAPRGQPMDEDQAEMAALQTQLQALYEEDAWLPRRRLRGYGY